MERELVRRQKTIRSHSGFARWLDTVRLTRLHCPNDWLPRAAYSYSGDGHPVYRDWKGLLWCAVEIHHKVYEIWYIGRLTGALV